MSAVLSIANLSKTFATTRVLDDISLELRAGESHALVGQNGSGKSTIIKILCGYHQPDPGASATVDGTPFRLGDPAAAAAAGLRFVHQDLGLVPALGALDNLALGRGYRRGRTGTIAWRQEAISARRMLDRLGYDFDLSTPVSHLSASERTGIAIARALMDDVGDVRLLVLDEPTAALPAAEVDRLLGVIAGVRARGVALLYVSHRLQEVFEVSDRVTVLRDGRRIATRDTVDLDESGLIELTVGRALKSLEELHGLEHEVRDDAVLSVRGLSGSMVDGLDLEVHAGEIVGIAGVTGSGREELGPLVFGGAARAGTVQVDGRTIPPLRPDVSIRAGMALVPAERLANAALGDMRVRENVTISGLAGLYGAKGLDRGAERREADAWLRRLGVVPLDGEADFLKLSGGNQQKVVLARALRLEPRLLILDEPTQGVDVGAKAAIHAIIQRTARRGGGVMLLSTESEELLGLCDRVIVLGQGAAVANIPAASVTARDLTQLTLTPPAAQRRT